MPPAEPGPKPLLQSLLVADHCYRDALTSKAIVAGIFKKLTVIPLKQEKAADGSKAVRMKATAENFQSGFTSGSPFAFLSFTEVYGQQEVTVRYATLDGNSVAFEFKIQLKSPSPLEVLEIICGLPPLPAVAGHYELSVLWDNEVLGSYRITAVDQNDEKQIPPKKGGNDA